MQVFLMDEKGFTGEEKIDILMDSVEFIENYDIYESILIELMNQRKDLIFEKILTKMSQIGKAEF